MKTLATLITLAAMMVVAATTFIAAPVAADRYVERVALTPVEAADGSWATLAQRAGLAAERTNPFVGVDGAPCGVIGNLPDVVVGQMFGGSWGVADGKTVRVRARNWELFRAGGTQVPGVRVELDGGIFLHAELGRNDTRFLFVGIAGGGNASDLATTLDEYLNPTGKFWSRFEDAVAKTATGREAAEAHDALEIMGITWAGGKTDVPDRLKPPTPAPRPLNPRPGASLPPVPESRDRGVFKVTEVVGGLIVLVLLVLCADALLRRYRRLRASRRTTEDPPPAEDPS